MFMFRDTKQHRFSRGCSTHRCQLHVFSVRCNHTSRTLLLDEQLNLIPLSHSRFLLHLLALIASLLGLHRLWCCSGCGCLLHRFHRHLRISCWTDQKQGSEFSLSAERKMEWTSCGDSMVHCSPAQDIQCVKELVKKCSQQH